MIDQTTVQSLKSRLFSAQEGHLYALLDGASIQDLPGNLARFSPEHACLYRGEMPPDLLHMAPHLVRIDATAPFCDWLLQNGWGNHWGVFVISPADLNTLRRHFRTFLMVYGPEGKSLYFRYYDPRVLRVFLPTCTSGELKTVFGPVASYLMEDADPKIRRKFMFVTGALHEEKVLLGQ